MRSLIVLAAIAASMAFGCSTTKRTELQLQHLLVTSPVPVTLTVVCDGESTYSIELRAGEPVHIGGPEALCVLTTDEPVDLRAQAVWDD